MTGYNRREEYGWFYDRMVVAGASRLRRTPIRPVREKPRPGSGDGNGGRSQVHSKMKLDVAYMWMDMMRVVDNQAYRQTESDRGRCAPSGTASLSRATPPRSGTCGPSRPNGRTGCRPRTARRRPAEASGADAPPGADSSGAETAWYGDAERPGKGARRFAGKPRKASCWKYHVTAVPGLQIMLTATATPGRLNDASM